MLFLWNLFKNTKNYKNETNQYLHKQTKQNKSKSTENMLAESLKKTKTLSFPAHMKHLIPAWLLPRPNPNMCTGKSIP